MSEKIRVIQVSSDTNIGGAGKCILTYLAHRSKSDFEVAAAVPEGSLLTPLISELGGPVFEVDAMRDKSFDTAAVKKLLEIFKKFKPDIVHAHASMSARIAARIYGAKVVYTRHSVFPPSKRLTRFPGKMLSGLANNATADRIIAVADAAKDNITAIGVSEKKISVILNGVEPLRQYSQSEIKDVKSDFGIPDGVPCITICARLTEVKGHKYFVDAAKILKDSGTDARFLIAGTGGGAENLRRQITSLGLDGYVKLLGFLNDVEPLMNITDIQANCSFGTEATSLALLEGMSLGKPAVVTDFGGNPGVIRDGINGFVVPTHSAEALAEKLKMLLNDSALYKRMCENSLEIFKQTFTAEKYAENIEKIYHELGGKK